LLLAGHGLPRQRVLHRRLGHDARDPREDRSQVRQAVPPRLPEHGAQAAQGVARASPGKPQRLPEGLSAGQVGLIDGTRGGRRVRPPPGPAVAAAAPPPPGAPPAAPPPRARAVAATASAPVAAPAPAPRRRRTSYSTWLLLLPALAVLIAFFL